jgi:hypothetical protein
MWWQQYKKELMGHRAEGLLIAGALVVWTFLLLSRVNRWSPEAIAVLYWLPMGFLPLWVLWSSVQLYRQEWRENTSYLMLSLPARAWVITSAKLAVLATGVTTLMLLIGAGAWLVAARTGILAELATSPDIAAIPREWAVKMSLLVFGVALAAFVTIGFLAQFAYVFSRLFSRFRGLVMVWTWILLFWLLGRAGDLGGLLLAWLPDFYVRSLNVISGIPEFLLVRIESGPFAAVALLLVGLYALFNAMLERAVEV